MVTLYFPTNDASAQTYCNRPEDFLRVAAENDSFLPNDLKAKLATTGRVPKAGDVKYVFVTKSGPGPINQPQSEALLDAATGEPREAGPKHKRLKIGEN